MGFKRVLTYFYICMFCFGYVSYTLLMNDNMLSVRVSSWSKLKRNRIRTLPMDFETIFTYTKSVDDLETTAISQQVQIGDRKIENNTSIDLDDVLIGRIYDPGFINPQPDKICPSFGENVTLLILVSTAPGNFKQRAAIRETWGNITKFNNTMKISFFIGVSKNETLNEIINQESLEHSDVIQTSIVDTYNNLTLKSVSMIQWVSEYCRKVKFLLKVDDDVYINLEKLNDLVIDESVISTAMYGMLAKKWKPIRFKKSKYYVSKRMYRKKYLPKFLVGPAYIIPVVLSGQLYEKSLLTKFFKLEDVFLTGIVANKLNITRVHLKTFQNERIHPKDVCLWLDYISVHVVSPHLMRSVFSKHNNDCKLLSGNTTSSTIN